MESMAKAGVAMAAGIAAMAAFFMSKPDSANLWATERGLWETRAKISLVIGKRTDDMLLE
jgi:hypothetical protein|eukprot:scaffold13594_cov198-Alexandrium_tamarense.AAC.26